MMCNDVGTHDPSLTYEKLTNQAGESQIVYKSDNHSIATLLREW